MEAASEFENGDRLAGAIEIFWKIVKGCELRRRETGGDRSRRCRAISRRANTCRASRAPSDAVMRLSERAVVEPGDTRHDTLQVFRNEDVAFSATIGYVARLVHFEVDAEGFAVSRSGAGERNGALGGVCVSDAQA